MKPDDLTGLNASLVADALQRLDGIDAARRGELAGIRALTGHVAVGPAYTVRVRPARQRSGDERARWFAAIDNAPPGAVLVIQAHRDIDSAVFGEMVALRFQSIGLVGVVVDGYSRDINQIRDIGLPFWTRDITMRGMLPDDADTESGVTLTIGAATIAPGDLVAADGDGVFVCPAARLSDVMPTAHTFRDSEVITQKKLRSGQRLFDVYPSKSAIALGGKS